MSVRVMADVWENGPNDATLTSILLVLANFANDAGGNCFPGTATIAKLSRYSERTVIRAISELESQGWIEVLQRGSGRPTGNDAEKAQYKSQFKLNVTKLKGCQPVSVSTDERVTMAQERVTPTTGKGDNDDKPPHPLKGVSVIEPSPIQVPDSADTRILCETIGIFNIREQEVMHRLFTVFCKTSKMPLEAAREHMWRRWSEYQKAMPNLEWTYSTVFKFFESGNWNKPDVWPPKRTVQKQDPMAKMKFAR